MEELQEKSLHPRDSVKIEIAQERTKFEELDENLQLAIRCAADKKAEKMVALDLRPVASFTEFFVICSAQNQRQVQAIADEISEQVKKQLKQSPVRIEGYSAAEWVLLDYGDFVFHIFDKDARDFYDLERLWRDAAKVELPEQL
jgi:ribosome-associated protein